MPRYGQTKSNIQVNTGGCFLLLFLLTPPLFKWHLVSLLKHMEKSRVWENKILSLINIKLTPLGSHSDGHRCSIILIRQMTILPTPVALNICSLARMSSTAFST